MPTHPSAPGRRPHEDHRPDETYRITTAPTSQTADIGIRYRKYVIQMVIRTACFLLFVLVHHWIRWFFVAGAVFLPYVAVVLANAGRESKGPPPESFSVPEEPVRQLPAIEASITDIRPPSPRPAPPADRPGAGPAQPHPSGSPRR
ncbi:DUF3099 domain-containing protein [Kineococcus rubinsiae]|uniref:DUF3099 domain-containing protein n=1 Tax=Kineococcus rubinsiae TaxID=2609562 RepID=UPI00142FF4F3|nr:DUF3099 domain-containing protein [Kineococcus rubinsiae]NIZ93576.1 DUF3099 domain-containing protein [Kineococcus rubinsiae]